MRAFVVSAVVLAIVPAAHAAPRDFVRAPILEPVASYVAKKPVSVWCARSDTAWVAGLASVGLPASAHGTSNVRRREIWLEKVICDNLAIAIRTAVPPSGYGALAPSILVFVHEAVHLRGVLGEGKADCTATRELPDLAVRFFGRQLVVPQLMKEVARYRKAGKAVYRTVC
jgi:hypothetical protein